MTAVAKGPLTWSVSRDQDGYRNYKLQTLVGPCNVADGPAVVMNASGLPAIGALWNFGNDNGVEGYAYCWPTLSATPLVTKAPNKWWVVENLFSNKPLHTCQTSSITNPLSQPVGLSGSFCRYMKAVNEDRDGDPIVATGNQLITGIEKNADRPTVVVSMNVASLGLDVFSPMINHLNDATLWGLAKRKIMLTNVSWERKLYGVCTFYYTRRLEFEVRYEGYDLDDVVNRGFKVRNGFWFAGSWIPTSALDPDDPNSYIVFKDENGENIPQLTLINNTGDPTSTVYILAPPIELYDESNFLTLGVPSSL